jgi:hypothetical protein
MLLSQENVLYHNEKDKDHFTRYDRVKEFVDDQVKQHYQSQRMNPNNEGKDSVSAYPTTASITSSKAHTPTAAPLVKARENKSTNGNMLHASSHLQLSKSKKFGLHLLEVSIYLMWY